MQNSGGASGNRPIKGCRVGVRPSSSSRFCNLSFCTCTWQLLLLLLDAEKKDVCICNVKKILCSSWKLGLTNWSNREREEEEKDLKVCKNQYYYAVFKLFSAVELSLGSRVVVPVMMVFRKLLTTTKEKEEEDAY